MNYYQVLNIEPTATLDEIKKAYRKMAKVSHPDSGGDSLKFQQISNAYETLSDNSKRAKYDMQHGFSNSGKWESYFNQAFGFGNGQDFSSMFDETFNHKAKGADVKIRVNLTMEEIYHGTTRYIDIGDNKFNIKIPKGIRNGAKLRIRNKGKAHPYNSSAPKGDVILVMQRLVDPDLIVNGEHIWVDLTLPFYDMLLGTRVNINTKVNESQVEVPKNAYEGQILTIAGGGMPIYNTDRYGDLMVKLIAKPVKLNEGQLELVKKIKQLNDG